MVSMGSEIWAPVIKKIIAGIVAIIVVLVALEAVLYFIKIESPGGGSSHLSAPTLKTVGENGITTDTTPLLDWNYDSNVYYYEIQVSDNDIEFTNPIINTTSYSSSYICSTLSPGTYYWRVRAVGYDTNYGSWAYWYFIIESTAPLATISENADTYVVHHEWSYGGSRWTYDTQIPKIAYEYFRNKPRVSYYSEYVDNPVDDNWMENLAHNFVEEARKKGWG